MNNLLLSLPLGFQNKYDITMICVIAILSAVLMIFVGYKLLQMLQLTGYKLRGYCRWFKETKYSYISRLFMLSFLSLASMLMTNVLLADFLVDVKFLKYVSILFYILFSSIFITNLFTAKQKTPLKYTKRMTRLVVVYTILVLLFSLVTLYVGFMYVPYLSYGLVGIIPIMLPIFVFLAYFITYPIEKMIANSYIRKARKKLQSMKDLKIIGITGSYGKTTVKNILNSFLSVKYKTCITPASFNTPLGLAKTILSNLSKNDQIFIAEMGAKQQRDIEELCQMINPQIGVITGIGNQHLLTFGSVETILKTKGELAEFVTKNNGELFINIDSEGSQQLAENYKNAITVSISNEKQSAVVATNIKTGKNGSTFDLTYDGDTVHCKTILLGNHNISNILIAAIVALKMGVELKDISLAIEKLVTIPHRLEIVKSTSTYTIIDDAYNSSVAGSKASLDVLSKFDGKKFVITPGLVELGLEQYNSNFEFGKDLAAVADFVIIDSTVNFEAISAGLEDAKFDKSKVIQVANLTQAVQMLNKLATTDDVVLFENDLPDNYS